MQTSLARPGRFFCALWFNLLKNLKLHMKPLFSLRFVALALLIGASLTSFGCRKKKDTVAKVYVRDGQGQPVGDATVRLYVKGENQSESNRKICDFDMSATTNSSGEARFILNDTYQLGQAGVVVADIQATKTTQVAEGVIKIEQEVTSEETVYF